MKLNNYTTETPSFFLDHVQKSSSPARRNITPKLRKIIEFSANYVESNGNFLAMDDQPLPPAGDPFSDYDMLSATEAHLPIKSEIRSDTSFGRMGDINELSN